jgi:hypothetical protein
LDFWPAFSTNTWGTEQNHENFLVGKAEFGERTKSADVRASGDTKMEGGSPLLAQGHEKLWSV